MSIQTDVSTDTQWLKQRIQQLEAEAESVWNRYETYAIIAATFFVGAIIGHLLTHH